MDEPACAAAAPSARAAPMSAVRLGLFGGSFDPPHQAHLALARAALAQLGLDSLLWLPAGRPWQKARELAPDADRLAMLRLLVAGEPRFAIDERELQRAGPSYTIDTLRELRSERPQGAAVPGPRPGPAGGAAELARLDGTARGGDAGRGRARRRARGAAARGGRTRAAPRAPGDAADGASSTAIRAHLAAGGTARDSLRRWSRRRSQAILTHAGCTARRSPTPVRRPTHLPGAEWTSENCSAPSSTASKT
jgi:cytidyltransferase-like protein